MTMKLVKKITVKTVLERKPTAALLGESDHYDVMTVYGTATEVTPGRHEFGDGNFSDYFKYRGQFAAIRVHDGQEFRSGIMILPDVAADVLQPAVAGKEEGADSVGFAFLIQIKKDESSATGYVFGASPLTEPEEHDPLNAIRARLAGAPGIPKLENKSEPEPAAEKAPPKKKQAAK